MIVITKWNILDPLPVILQVYFNVLKKPWLKPSSYSIQLKAIMLFKHLRHLYQENYSILKYIDTNLYI